MAEAVKVEFSILKPPLDDYFAFREEANAFQSLAMQRAKKGVFHTAERAQLRYGCRLLRMRFGADFAC
jgi:hypothetical protein